MKSSKYNLLLFFISWWMPAYSWKIIVEKYDIKNYDETIGSGNISMTRSNRTIQVFNLYVELFKDMPANVYFVAKLYGQYSNKYNELPFNYNRKFCDIYKHEYSWIKNDLKGVWPKSCPIKKGIYYIENYIINLEKFPSLPWDTNNYMADAKVFINKEMVVWAKIWVRVTREDEIKIPD